MLEHADVTELAESFKEQGIINPIEIDEKGMIITGARRWMAGKKAGFKTIPCRVVEGLTPDERFARQLIENLQRDELATEDTANAVLKLKESGMTEREIAQKIGKSPDWVHGQMLFCGVDDSLKNAVEAGNIALSTAINLSKVVHARQKQITKKIIKEKIPRYLVRDLVRAIEDKPDKTEKILELDFRDPATGDKLRKLAPPPAFLRSQGQEAGMTYIKMTRELLKFMQRFSPTELAPMYKQAARSNTHDLIEALKEWTKEF